jgi:DNA ligase-1
MKSFARFLSQLDTTNKTNNRLAMLKDYLQSAPDQDKLWALALFTHKRPRRQINTRLLRNWAAELAGIPDWLFEESYHTTGDLAETISLILPHPEEIEEKSLSEWIAFMNQLAQHDEEGKKAQVIWALSRLSQAERFVFIKIMTGGFRIGISQQLMTRAVAELYQIETSVVAHRLMGQWKADEISFRQLIFGHDDAGKIPAAWHDSRPYPFCLAHPLNEEKTEEMGFCKEWQAEWKWDGIRAQLIVRNGQLYVWSRGEELVTEKYPELAVLAQASACQNCVFDGELLAWQQDTPLPFGELQKRIGRKSIPKKLLQEVPVVFMAYDLLEYQGSDIRRQPLAERRALLSRVLSTVDMACLKLSPVVQAESWAELGQYRQQARQHLAEGLMLKKLSAPYASGRTRGIWWKWKVAPLSIDGVLIYAQKGHGRRATLYTDYTFGVWNGDKLLTFAKAYSGLSDAEIAEVDAFIKKNTVEKFGPVRTVKPELVFEIGFEGIQKSARHKSGIALRFPRILRWRRDKPASEADTLQALQALADTGFPNAE